MIDDIFLSIIIPVYNMEKYIGECIKSLEQQHFEDDVEIILVNDGSTDKSFDIMKNYQEHSRNVFIINQLNSGVAAARNEGLAKAKGKYVAWIDPDDYICEDWWNVLRPELEKCPDMVYFDMYTLKDGVFREIAFDKKTRYISHEELCKELAVGNRIQSHLWSKIILRSLFNKSFSTRYSYCEDFALLHHILFYVKVCRYIHKPLYIYRQLETSIVHDETKMLDNYRLGISLYKKRFRFFKNNGMIVPYDGVWNAMLNYCLDYERHNGENIYIRQKNINYVCLNILRHNIFKIVSSNYFTFKHKIKFIVVTLGGIKIFNGIKKMIQID